MTPVLMFPSAWLSTGAFLDAAYVAINWSIYAIFFGLVPHEYGHAAVAKFVGIRHSTIHLFGIFGVWQPDDEKSMLQLSSMQRIMICMAGPLTNLLIAGLFLLIAFWTPWANFDLLQHIIAVSLFIGLLNLFPLWPLDGGQVLFEILCLLKVKRQRVVEMVSVSTAFTGAAYLYWLASLGDYWSAALCGLFLILSLWIMSNNPLLE